MKHFDLRETPAVDGERSHVIERIVHLTLDILYLLTGEDYIVLKMAYGRVTHSSSPCISGGFGRTSSILASPPSPTNDKKILEVAQKMIELLRGQDGERSDKEAGSTSQPVKQEVDVVLRSRGGSGTGNMSERRLLPPPLDSWDEEPADNAKMVSTFPYNPFDKEGNEKEDLWNRTGPWVKEEAEATEPASKARRRGRPRKRKILEEVSGSLSPLSLKDLHVIIEDFQGKAKEVSATKEDQQEEHKREVTKDHHTDKKWLPPTNAALAITEDEKEEESKETDWEISAEGSIHNMASNSPSPSQDNFSEDTIVRVSLGDVQEASDPSESTEQSVYRNSKRKTFTCLDCGSYFMSSELLESHYKVHTGEAPFSCMACGSSFSSSEELEEHVRFHTSEKLYACSQCGKCFTMKANLIAHRRVHTGNKPFSCAECGRRFAQRSSLEKHLPVHALEKPYPCVVCGKCFTTSSRLAAHQTTHTGEKSYECVDCGKVFTTSSSMNRHRRTHTGEKPYSCSICGKCFNRETNLYRHQLIHTR